MNNEKFYYQMTTTGELVKIDSYVYFLTRNRNLMISKTAVYVILHIGKYLVKLHKLVIGNANCSRFVADHRNGDPLDNRSCNLRWATTAQNAHNRKKRKSSASRFKGVNRTTYITKSGESHKWNVRFQSKNIRKTFPYTPAGEIEAAKFYDRVAYKFYKDFAYLNFPEDVKNEKSTNKKNLSDRNLASTL